MTDDERRVFGSDNNSDADFEDIPCEVNKESDVSRSDLDRYSSEEWSEEFVEGQRNKREQGQLQIYVDGEAENILGTQRDNRYDPGCPIHNITFVLGMRFESSSQFKTAVKNYAIWNGFNVKFFRSGEKVVEVICEEHCPWRIYGSYCPTREAFVVKVLSDDHRCSRAPRNRHADYRWIAQHFLEKFRNDMNWKVVDMMQEINEQFGIIVTRHTCYNARSAARKMLEGSLNDHHRMPPPFVKKQPRRPEHKRTDISERDLSGQRLPKKGMQMKCSLCQQVGHNRRTCVQRTIQAASEGSQGAIELSRTEVDEVYQPMIDMPCQPFEPIQQPSQPSPTPTPTENGQCSSDRFNNFWKSTQNRK